MKTQHTSNHYDDNYFNWQKEIGEFGGWANSFKFKKDSTPKSVLLDFGCGGGYLLDNMCAFKKIGVEPNLSATKSIESKNIIHFHSSQEALQGLGVGTVDIIISNHALEHVLNPLDELKSLYRLLRIGGKIHFYVPCDSVSYKYDKNDINNHLFSWSPQNLGNIFREAGFKIEYCAPFMHKWPPCYKHLRRFGWSFFNLICKAYSRIERSYFQVEIIARK